MAFAAGFFVRQLSHDDPELVHHGDDRVRKATAKSRWRTALTPRLLARRLNPTHRSEVIIEKHWRGVTPRSVCDFFWDEVNRYELKQVRRVPRMPHVTFVSACFFWGGR